MKQDCPTYLKSIGKSKALTTTLSDTKPEDDSNNEDDRILNAFTATVNPTEGIVEDVNEEEELVESKFEKMDEQELLKTLGLRRLTLENLNKRSSISVIIIELPVILDQITISG